MAELAETVPAQSLRPPQVLSAAAPHPFPHLERLDLSFNELHGDVLIQLSSLKRLKSLDLSNNCVPCFF